MNKQGKVWGETVELFNKNNVEIHRIVIEPDGYCSTHCHVSKFNMFYVEAGSINVLTYKNDYDLVDTTILGYGQIHVVRPGEYHKFINKDPNKQAIVYEIYWTELRGDDIVRKDVGGLG